MGRKFSKKFLNEVLGFNDKEINLVMKAQKIFPSILIEDGEGFCLDGRLLYSELGVSKAFSTWIKTNLQNVDAIEGKDFDVSFQGNVDLSQEKIKNLTPQQRSRRGISEEYKLTLEIAKEVCMVTGLGNKTGEKLRENSKLIRSYFILMEKAIKGMQKHLVVREPEKAGYNEMREYIAGWYTRNCPGAKINPYVFAKEADMLNIALMGKSAKSIKELLSFNDINTREHLKIEINKALYELQILNSSLLIANMDFQQRKSIIEATCKAKYDILKLKINKEFENEEHTEKLGNIK